MKAVILAAGEGKRMRPLTKELPKPMILVLGKPLLEYTFAALPDEINEVILVVRYLGDKIKEHFGSNFFGKKITYTEGSELGTACSFLSARKYLDGEKRFLFIYGDECPNSEDIKKCLEYNSSILCWEVNDPWNHGVVNFGPDNTITKIVEKPKEPESNIIAGGVMVLTPTIFEYEPYLGAKGEFNFTDMVAEYIKKEKVKAMVSKEALGGISTVADIKRVEEHLRKRRFDNK